MQKLNKLGFIQKDSPYYGWLTSIFSAVLKVAVQHNINLIFYGENGEIEYGGSMENKNNPIFDAKYNFLLKNLKKPLGKGETTNKIVGIIKKQILLIY
tara:strand:+ start:1868 stop:2161 length:294 start_codon:yes stop_codon:yes gene_type:complete